MIFYRLILLFLWLIASTTSLSMEGPGRIFKPHEFTLSGTARTGIFADVHDGVINESGEKIAIKVFALGNLQDHLISEFNNYYKLALLNSEYLVHYYGLCSTPDNIALLMERMPVNLQEFYNGTALHKFKVFYRDKDSVFKEKLLERYKNRNISDYASLLAQIAKGIDFLHRNGVAHKNLKNTNIFVWFDGEQFRIKISDHGLSHIKLELSGAAENEAPVRWRASETFTRYYRSQFDTASLADRYSYGLLGLELATKSEPFSHVDGQEAIRFCSDPVKSNETALAALDASDCPKDFITIIKASLAIKPAERADLIWSAQAFEKIRDEFAKKNPEFHGLPVESSGKLPKKVGEIPTQIKEWQMNREVYDVIDVSDQAFFGRDKIRASIPAHGPIDEINPRFVLVILDDYMDLASILALSETSKLNNTAAKQVTKQKVDSYYEAHPELLEKFVFGKEQWLKHFPNYHFPEDASVNFAPGLHKVIVQKNPEQPNQEVGATYMLVLIPADLQFHNFLKDIYKQPCENFLLDHSLCGARNNKDRSRYDKIPCESIFNCINEPKSEAHWVLINNHRVCREFVGLKYDYYAMGQQRNLHPTPLQAAVAILAYFYNTGGNLLRFDEKIGVFTQSFFRLGDGLELRLILGFLRRGDDGKPIIEVRLTDKVSEKGVIYALSLWQPPRVK